jgi:hypothetical protein
LSPRHFGDYIKTGLFNVKREVTFAQLDAVLAELGFAKQVVSRSHPNYRHAALDSPLMVRLHKPNDLVPGYVLLAARVELDRFGIVAADDFVTMLQAQAA